MRLTILTFMLANSAYAQWTPPTPPAQPPPEYGQPDPVVNAKSFDIDPAILEAILDVLEPHHPDVVSEIEAALANGSIVIKFYILPQCTMGLAGMTRTGGAHFVGINLYSGRFDYHVMSSILYHEWLHVRGEYGHPGAIPGNHTDPCIHQNVHTAELEYLCTLKGLLPSIWNEKLEEQAKQLQGTFVRYCLMCWQKQNAPPGEPLVIPPGNICNPSTACSCCPF
jgi:hypothetical protein